MFVDKEKTSPVKRVASGTLTLSERCPTSFFLSLLASAFRMLTFRYCRPKDDMSGTLEIPFDDILTIKKVSLSSAFPNLRSAFRRLRSFRFAHCVRFRSWLEQARDLNCVCPSSISQSSSLESRKGTNSSTQSSKPLACRTWRLRWTPVRRILHRAESCRLRQSQ